MPLPVPSLYTLVIQGALDSIGPIIAGATDPSGNALAITTRAQYSPLSLDLPHISVSYEPGEIVYGNGNNWVDTDQNTGAIIRGFYALGGTISFHIEARSEAEREWIADLLFSGIPALGVADPTVNGSPIVPHAVTDSFGAFGLMLTGMKKPEYPAPALDDARPTGEQVYKVTLPWTCDVSFSWQETPISVSQIEVTSAFALAQYTFTEPTFVVNSSTLVGE